MPIAHCTKAMSGAAVGGMTAILITPLAALLMADPLVKDLTALVLFSRRGQ